MTVTDIIEHDKKKVFLQFDGEITIPLYIGEVRKYHLQKGEEVPKAIYTEIMEELLPKRAKLRAMHLLQKRTYTRAMLRRKLLEGRYPDMVAEEALDYVASYGYVDDAKYAAEYIRCYCESRSRKRIIQELSCKGVSKDIIEKAWCAFEEENMPIDEEAQIMELLAKKRFNAKTADQKEKIRVMNFLYRKGYSMDGILHCMRME